MALAYTVYSDPVVSSLTANHASVDVGQPVTFTATAALGTGSYPTFTWTNLPTGCPAATTAQVVCSSVTIAGTSAVAVSVTDSNGATGADGTLSMTVFADPTITTPTSSSVSADVGGTVSFSASGSSGSGGYSYSWSGLPSGCTSVPSVGTVSCPSVTPAGTYSVRATVTDSNGFSVTSASTSFTVYADPLPTTPTGSVASADVGQAVTFTSTNTLGSGSFAWSWSGLPSGCPSSATATVSCVSVTVAGTFSVTATVTDSNGVSATSGALGFTVYSDPTVGSVFASRSSADVGQAVTFTASGSLGTGTYATFTWSGLPTGCPVATTAQVICASVTAAATYSASVKVTDSNGFTSALRTTTFTVDSDPSITTPVASRSTSDVGQSTTFTASASGGSGGYSYGWSGLPTGCASSSVSGSIGCTVTAAGTFTTIVSVTDSNGYSLSSNPLVYVVNADPVPTTPKASVGSADVGQAVTFTTSATLGSGGYTWSWSDLPAGCSTSATPTVSCGSVTTAGIVTVTATVTDSNDVSVTSAGLAFTVYADPTATAPSANRTSTDVGQAVQFTTAGGLGSGGYTFTWAGLPTGCSGSTDSIRCVPTTSGGFSVTATVTDSNGFTSASPATPFTVFADPVARAPTASTASADVGQTVTFAENASSGSGGYTYLWSGLPSGCPGSNLGSSLTCDVTTSAIYAVTVTVQDSNRGAATSSALTFQVYADPTVAVPMPSASSADDGQTIIFTATASSGTGTYSYAWSGLPSGCTGVASSSVTCLVSGSLNIVVTVTDSNGYHVQSGALAYTVYSDPTTGAPVANRTSADAGQLVTFSTVAAGGSGGYVFDWIGLPVACASTAASVSCALTTSASVSVSVTDSNGVRGTSTVLVYTVYPDPTVATPLANRTSMDAGQNVTFTSSVTVPGAGGVTFYWQSSSPSFACGISGTVQVSCRASSPGSYAVTLTATDLNGGSGTSTSLSITALADPTVSMPTFSPRTTFDVATSVSGNVTASGGAGGFSYTWQGLPSGCTGLSSEIRCTAASAGTFSVRVWVVDANGFGLLSPSTTVVVNPALLAAISGNRQTSTVGLAVTLNANTSGGTGPFNYTWLLGDGSRQYGAVASHEYANSGTYSVTLWVNDSGGSSVVKYWVVSVGPAPSVLDIPSPNVAQLELIAALLILIVVVIACVLIVRRRQEGGKSGGAPVQPWQQPAAAAPAPAPAPAPAKAPRSGGKGGARTSSGSSTAPASSTSSKTNIDQTLAELEAISGQDNGPNEP